MSGSGRPYAGLRVLPGGEGGTASARRETVYTRGRGGMLSVAGGKLTTYRRIALDALDEIRADLGLAPDRSPAVAAAGRRGARADGAAGRGHPGLRSHLLQLYGSLAGEVLAPAVDDPSLLEPLTADAPDIAAQVLYAARSEWARSAEDVVRRRTTLALRGRAGPDVTKRVEELISARVASRA